MKKLLLTTCLLSQINWAVAGRPKIKTSSFKESKSQPKISVACKTVACKISQQIKPQTTTVIPLPKAQLYEAWPLNPAMRGFVKLCTGNKFNEAIRHAHNAGHTQTLKNLLYFQKTLEQTET